ncbi:hypothetical protein GUITHDRAFT_122618 [Guillardia theta CCMP2712]|uniref:Uncharacterized protein n=1 Tax=Guillardia theta (strain CCMP2712) TaxID=905079 RepID=L1I4K1_GUITC|nr:hypothetical protein GUITHDRAFT_122618 [Guillardia theta CCMP2712]EKX31176.1 hypothetical protein GUITHDRAFT_122618 [Guillardia theta CCMP2712]|eukprot:XP_005818156.1 hypothetical protein GUITHDRAFT_122618 [Guillardia theta CCMP2712]
MTQARSCDSNNACKTFVRASLAVNIVVLIAVCTVVIAPVRPEAVTLALGPPTPGRGILLSVYFAILIDSVILLGLHLYCSDTAPVEYMIAALLATQVLYKISTPATAGVGNPVAISNLCISVLHTSTLYLLWRGHTRRVSAAPASLAMHAN